MTEKEFPITECTRAFVCRTERADLIVNLPLPLVSVTILSYNRRTELRRTLQAVLEGLNYPADMLEVIVVDNASQDGSAEMVEAEFSGVRLIQRNDNCGVSAWNDGFAVGRGEYILVLDDDCYVEGDDLLRAVRAAQSSGAGLVSFSVGNPNEPGFYFNKDVNPGLLSFWGCAALIQRNVINAIGGYEPAIFVYTHELEFTMRLLNAGFSHLLLPEVQAMHNKPFGKSKEFSVRAPLLWASNRGVILGKLMPFPWCVLLVARTFTGYVRHGFRNPLQTATQIWSFIKGFALGCKKRAPVRVDTASFYCRNYMEFAPTLMCFGALRQRREQALKERRKKYYPDVSTLLFVDGFNISKYSKEQ